MPRMLATRVRPRYDLDQAPRRVAGRALSRVGVESRGVRRDSDAAGQAVPRPIGGRRFRRHSRVR
jgi:hypothetical protein